MKRVYSNDYNIKKSIECNASKCYLLFTGCDYYMLVLNPQDSNHNWTNLDTGTVVETFPKARVSNVIEMSHRLGDIYEFNTMQELLEYYLEQIKKK